MFLFAHRKFLRVSSSNTLQYVYRCTLLDTSPFILSKALCLKTCSALTVAEVSEHADASAARMTRRPWRCCSVPWRDDSVPAEPSSDDPLEVHPPGGCCGSGQFLTHEKLKSWRLLPSALTCRMSGPVRFISPWIHLRPS